MNEPYVSRIALRVYHDLLTRPAGMIRASAFQKACVELCSPTLAALLLANVDVFQRTGQFDPLCLTT